LIQELNEQFPVWMFKDPRTVLTLPFWQSGISTLQLIGTFRHPLKVAMSLYQRQSLSIPLREGIKLWIYYNSLILKAFNQASFPLICFDLPQTEYLAKLQEVIKELNTQIPDDFKLSLAKVTEFYESTLVHQENIALFAPTSEDTELLAQAELLYQELCAKAGLNFNQKAPQINKLLVPLSENSQTYQEALVTQPHNSQLYFMLAKIQKDEGSLEQAIATSKKAWELNPENVDIIEQLSQLLIEAKQETEALALVKQLFEFQPNNLRLYLILGNLQRQQQDLSGAIATYQQAIKLLPQNLSSFIHLGNLLRQTNRVEEAIINGQQALEFHPQNYQTYFNLGMAYAQKKDWEKAISLYQEAIELGGQSSAIIYVNLGDAFNQQGNKSAALANYQQAINSQPDSVHGYIALGNYYRQKQEWEQAITNYQEAISLNCQNPGAYFTLGQVFREQGDLEKAIANYQKAIDLNHSNLVGVYKALEAVRKTMSNE
ncbi:MAG: tetratricopeptide repeat protein, partial [Waterburya sp.]